MLVGGRVREFAGDFPHALLGTGKVGQPKETKAIRLDVG